MSHPAERPDCFGEIRPRHYRRPQCRAIVIHRNTVADMWREKNPDWVGDDALATALFHREAPPGAEHFDIFPYHFFVDRAGRAFQTLPFHVIGQHAKGRNHSTVAIAMCHDGRRSPPSPEVIEGVARCIRATWEFFRLGPDGCDIVGHDPVKACPGTHVDLDHLKEVAVGGYASTG